MNAQRIFIVDHERQIMNKPAISLTEKGNRADSTRTLLPIPSSLRNSYYEVVAFGISLSNTIKRNYDELLRFHNSGILSATAMNSLNPVLDDQMSMAFNRKLQKDKPVSYINYDINEGCLAVMIHATKACEVEVTLHNSGIFKGSREKSLFKEVVEAGEHFIKFEEKALAGFGTKFMVIKVDGMVIYMQRL